MERPFKTHQTVNPADHRLKDVPNDPTEHIRGCICNASVRYARANYKLIGSLYDPTKPTSYIMEMDANKLYGWDRSQEMPHGKFEWLNVDECRNMKQLLNTADGRISIFDLGLFDHRLLDKKKSYILEVNLEYPPELHEQDDDYPLAPEVMTSESETTGRKQHNLRAHHFGAACPFSRKLICSFVPKKHNVVLGQLLRFYLER